MNKIILSILLCLLSINAYADSTINQRTDLTGNIAADDEYAIWDTSTGTTKKISAVDVNVDINLDTLAALKAITPPTDAGKIVYVRGRTTVGDGYEGFFRWDSSDQSANVTADTLSGIYVPPDSDATGASGVWVRILTHNTVTPLMFGAIGDGTENDTAAVQAMLTLIDGVPIDLLHKTYLVDALTSSNDVIMFNGTLKSNTLTSNMLELSGSNISLDNITFTSSFSGTGDISYAAIYGLYADRGEALGAYTVDSKCKITNCKFIDYRNTGCNVVGYDFFDFVNNIIDNLGAEGLKGLSCNNVTIIDNTVRSTYGGGLQHGAGSGTYDSAIISNNRLTEVYPGNATTQGDAYDHGIAIELNSAYVKGVVSDNIIKNPHSMGISLSSGSSNVVTGNVVNGCGQSSRSTGFTYRGYASIEIVNADWCNVNNNKIIDPYQTGIIIDKSHYCNINANHFHNSQGVTRSSTQYFIRLTGTANDLLNASYGNKIDNNVFDNGGENYAGQADELCYAVYTLLNAYGYHDDHVQTFSNNTVVDSVIELAGRWSVDGNTINSTGVLDLSTSSAWGNPLLRFVNESAPNVVRNTTYYNTNATATVGFMQITGANINNVVIQNCEIKNTTSLVYASAGFLGAISVVNTHIDTVTNVTNRGKNGSNYYLDVVNCTGDRLADLPRIVYGPGTGGISSPIAGDIVFDITPTASGKIGWAYDGSAAAWKQFGVIDP